MKYMVFLEFRPANYFKMFLIELEASLVGLSTFVLKICMLCINLGLGAEASKLKIKLHPSPLAALKMLPPYNSKHQNYLIGNT